MNRAMNSRFSNWHISGTNAIRLSDDVLNSDEFQMFAFKIKPCPRNRSHNWMECPYAHDGEKAVRRDPCRFNYIPFLCPWFRQGYCYKGHLCELAHGVFEYWLHPARYRTQFCKVGRQCNRKVCFFAHSPEQLRPKPQFICTKPNCSCRVHCRWSAVTVVPPSPSVAMPLPKKAGLEDVSRIVQKLNIKAKDANKEWLDVWDPELVQLGWIPEVV